MADEPEAQPPEPLEEEEGGPVKSFLEHLEDLRWVLIKSLAAAGVAMVACFFGGNYLTKILLRPLAKAPIQYSGKTAQIFLGTNQLALLSVKQDDVWSGIVGTNRHVRLEFVPIPQDGTVMLGCKITAENDQQGLNIPVIGLGPAESFIVATKLALYGGLVIASPFIFYYVAAFVFPALKMREK